MKKKMTFIEVLNSEYKSIVESLEHGSSDKENIEYLKKELFEKTGYVYL